MKKRTLIAVAASVLVFGGSPFAVAPEAGAQDRAASRKAKASKQVKRSRPRVARSKSADCTYFDNGKSDSELNFRNPCDAEEFWRRQADRAGDSNE